ncbi:caspase family protein [Polyangium mundeleinium]|uniref:Caspase family protein n=1 Tax=Polyangium mundeleinium TaxID=2995306 RepID=A0ABT5ET13_9BACT|nr:caspase family protein [Polyangium mundeleinium]MDC0744960.1 caspase family protein [Polyangium mundeleinium]
MTASRREMLEDEDEVPEAPVRSPGSGQDYALVIGVNHYPKLRALQGAVADAKAFAAWLVEPDGGRLSPENVRTVLSMPDPLSPIGHEINDALEDLLECAATSGGRRFYFYFGGHGCVGDRAADITLCMANWSELRRRAALSSEAWLDVVVRSGAFDEVAFFLDCCRIWAMRAVGLPPHIDFVRPVERAQATRVFVAYATEFQRPALEVSMDTSAEARGIFTQVLLAGLRGEAARAGGVVTAVSLKDHLEASVAESAKSKRLSQRAEVVNGLEVATRFGFALRPPRLKVVFIEAWTSDVYEVVLLGPDDEVVMRGDPRHGPWELDVPAGDYELHAGKNRWCFHYAREGGITPQVVRLGGMGRRVTLGSFSPRDPSRSIGSLSWPLEAWLPAHPTHRIHHEIAVCTAWLDPLPKITARAADIVDAPSMLFVVLLDAEMPPWSVRLGAGWSIHGENVTVELDRENTWDDTRGWSVFSARLMPGSYCLRWAGKRDIAVRLFPGFTTQIVIDHAAWKPRFESPRMFLVPTDRDVHRPPPFDVASAVESGLGQLASAPGELPPPLAKVMTGASFDDPMLGLLGAHLLAREKTPDPTRIEALADHVASLLGPCPDVHALRLRVALLRGADLPRGTWSEPPLLREGLITFVEASHEVPELIAAGSLLEHACVERLVDSALSSWPTRRESGANEDDWLTAAIADAERERALPGAALDAQTLAKELGVPTLAVRARLAALRSGGLTPAADAPNDERTSPDYFTAARLKEAGKRCWDGDFKGALALAEAILAADPENLTARHYAEISCEKLQRTTFLVPRLVGSSDAAARMGTDDRAACVIDAIDGELPLGDVVDISGLPPLDALRIIQELVVAGVIEMTRVG